MMNGKINTCFVTFREETQCIFFIDTKLPSEAMFNFRCYAHDEQIDSRRLSFAYNGVLGRETKHFMVLVNCIFSFHQRLSGVC